jgi:hypothetical protein
MTPGRHGSRRRAMTLQGFVGTSASLTRATLQVGTDRVSEAPRGANSGPIRVSERSAGRVARRERAVVGALGTRAAASNQS